MPNYAYLEHDLVCISCGNSVSDMVVFQWGYCPARAEIKSQLYRIGDAIRWRRCADNTILSWTYFRQGQTPGEANIGEPALMDLITRDVAQFYWDDTIPKRRCPRCHGEIDGAIVIIRSGVIVQARIYRSDEQFTIYNLISQDGTVHQVPEWDDHAMRTVDTC